MTESSFRQLRDLWLTGHLTHTETDDCLRLFFERNPMLDPLVKELLEDVEILKDTAAQISKLLGNANS